jgi:hypothetical protein
MKKLVIASLVGGIIIFIWQTLSWTVLNIHGSSQQYTSKQDSIMAFLNTQFSEDGAYLMPNYPKGTTREEMEKTMDSRAGKPWMQIQYHKALNVNMGANILRGLINDIIIVALFCWIIFRLKSTGFYTLFVASLFTGLIVFLNSPYTIHIWYPKADIIGHLLDALVSWGLCGLWLAWYLKSSPERR